MPECESYLHGWGHGHSCFVNFFFLEKFREKSDKVMIKDPEIGLPTFWSSLCDFELMFAIVLVCDNAPKVNVEHFTRYFSDRVGNISKDLAGQSLLSSMLVPQNSYSSTGWLCTGPLPGDHQVAPQDTVVSLREAMFAGGRSAHSWSPCQLCDSVTAH